MGACNRAVNQVGAAGHPNGSTGMEQLLEEHLSDRHSENFSAKPVQFCELAPAKQPAELGESCRRLWTTIKLQVRASLDTVCCVTNGN